LGKILNFGTQMTSFEKEQTLEAIKTVVMARWFFVTAGVVQVVLVRTLTTPLSAMPFSFLALLAGSCYGYNFLYWLYLRRNPEKMSITTVRALRVLQVVGDMMIISAMLYVDQTVTIFVAAFYLDVVLIASILYKKRGIFLTSFFTCLLFTVLAFIEYFGFFPPLKTLYYYSVKGNHVLLERTLIIFYTCLGGAGFLSGYIATIFRKREKRLQVQRDELIDKTNILTQQKGELAQTQEWLNDALVKSDKARLEVTATKEELEGDNLQLNKKIEELEKFYRVTVGRELKMVELKKEIKNLKDITERAGRLKNSK